MVILFRTIKKHMNLSKLINGYQREKTCLWGFRPCMTRLNQPATFTLCPRRPRQSQFRPPWTKRGDRNTT